MQTVARKRGKNTCRCSFEDNSLFPCNSSNTAAMHRRLSKPWRAIRTGPRKSSQSARFEVGQCLPKLEKCFAIVWSPYCSPATWSAHILTFMKKLERLCADTIIMANTRFEPDTNGAPTDPASALRRILTRSKH